MVELDCDATRRDGVTLVAAVVTNARTTPQRVRLESRLDGPTWSPAPDTATPGEWTDREWTGTVEPGRSRGVGFASSAPPVEPPLSIADTARAPRDRPLASATSLASLADWTPPRTLLERR